MKLADAMALVVPAVQDLKRRSQRRRDGETRMNPTLVALRDDRVLCVVSTPRLEVSLACAPTLAIGLQPQLLVLAAQVRLPGREATQERPAQPAGEAIAYTTMNSRREGALAVQPYQVDDEGEVRFGRPEKGQPHDRQLLEQLAAAMGHMPLDPARVAPKQSEQTPRAAEAAFLPAEQGRLVIDAGTARSVHQKVAGAGGTVLYLAASGAHATRLLAHGMPQELLLEEGRELG
ncbi:hypothetical protein [Ornithinicoccus halotolerans]|uniref:hypothetical protein n=1 Tax=Ornithinicoccus halotolerans TaxID=1748220 RepID=UPI001294A097|nr:hypothetical protein [Ornithinicoccus halotolerans]